MPKVTNERLRRIHIQVYEDDWQFLLLAFGDQTKRSAVIRDIVRDFVKNARERAQRRANSVASATIRKGADAYD